MKVDFMKLTAADAEKARKIFGNIVIIDSDDPLAFITDEITEESYQAAIASLGVSPLSHIRFV